MPSPSTALRAGAGSDTKVFNSVEPNTPRRSRFDLSRITNFTCDSGMIIPFDWFETVPGDSFDLSAEVAVESLPTITNVLTPYHVRTYWYYCRCSDLWAGWETFVTRGRTGNINLNLPQYDPNWVFTGLSGSKYSYSVPHSLQSFLGCLPSYGKQSEDSSLSVSYLKDYLSYGVVGNGRDFTDYTSTGYSNVSTGVNALPFMMYQNICKYYFVDQNLLQGNTALFPEQGDADWRLPYDWDADNVGFVTTVDGHYVTAPIGGVTPFQPQGIYTSSETTVGLGCLRYAMFEDDYFTSGLPWLERGNVHTLDFDIDFSDITATFTGTTVTMGIDYDNGGHWTGMAPNTLRWTGSAIVPQTPNYPGEFTRFSPNGTVSLSAPDGVGSTITANQLRELIAYSIWQERNARVDGSYNAMIWVHFNDSPNSPEHQARFIGGTSDYINFSEIFQSSESGTTPQGSVTSQGSLYSRQNVGRFNAPDYGYIMGIMVISPMTTYNTAQPHELVCPKVFDDFYMPEFEGLSPMPVLNKEIFATGTQSTDDGLFAYQERYSWLKSRANVNRGLFRLPSGTDTLFSSASQSRNFTSLPSFSYQFKVQSPDNTRRDWLAYPAEPMFKVQVSSKVDAVRPMSYVCRPSNFGM